MVGRYHLQNGGDDRVEKEWYNQLQQESSSTHYMEYN